jgi:hypothetical protein
MTSFLRLGWLLCPVFAIAACGGSDESSAPTDSGAGDTASAVDTRVADASGADTATGTETGTDTATSAETATESGTETGTDAATADTADAPACPTLKPSRRSSCPQLDQICFYGCGIVMRCTVDGWDNDLTIDGGPPCP